MSISTTVLLDTFNGDASTTDFPTSFPFFDETDLVVTLSGVTKTLNVDYTVTGGGDAPGVVTFPVAPPVGVGNVVIARRNMPLTQPYNFRSQGQFFPKLHEASMDRLLLLLQQLKDAYEAADAAIVASGAQPANVALATLSVNGGPLRTLLAHLNTLPDTLVTPAGGTTAFTPANLISIANGFVNVKWFGATGDGTTDDKTAIQNAITAASRATILAEDWNKGSGGTVFFPRGVYRTTGGFTITTDAVSLVGEGAHCSVIRMDANATTDAIYFGNGTGAGRNCQIRDLGIHGSTRTKFRDGVVIDSCTWPVLHNVKVTNAAQYGFRIRGTQQGQFTKLMTVTCKYGIWMGRTAGGVELTTAKLDHAYVLDSDYEGIILENCFATTLDSPIVQGCGVLGGSAGGTGIQVGVPAANGYSTHVTINNPYFEGNRGWDMSIGNDTAFGAAMCVVTGGTAFATNKTAGYGYAKIDIVKGGAIIGGYLNGYAAPWKSILCTNNGWNFHVIGVDHASTGAPFEGAGGGPISTWKGLVTTYDGNADVFMNGRIVGVAGGPGGGRGVNIYRAGAMPTSGTYGQGDVVYNSAPAAGQPMGWVRLTTGTAHVLNTDWRAMPNL